MKKNYFYVDTETTNTDPRTGAVIGIGAVCNGEEFHTLIKPHEGAVVAHKALDVNGLTITELETAPTNKEAVGMLCSFLEKSVDKYDKTDKLIMAGFNVGFDDRFLRSLFQLAGNPFLGAYKWSTLYDVQVPAIAYLQPERGSMENFKLGTVAKQLGIDMAGRKLHTALDDIKLTIEVDEILTKGLCLCQR
jgi:DNA polymerase-3 subunit epsilon